MLNFDAVLSPNKPSAIIKALESKVDTDDMSSFLPKWGRDLDTYHKVQILNETIYDINGLINHLS